MTGQGQPWPGRVGAEHTDRLAVIDADLGMSGATAAGRPGFAELVSEVGLGHVGIALGAEVSRLARSGRDWYQLMELCSLAGTLLADSDGVYDPGQYNDRLLLGLSSDAAAPCGLSAVACGSGMGSSSPFARGVRSPAAAIVRCAWRGDPIRPRGP